MISHKIGTREEWLDARRDLLKKEKSLTQLSDLVTDLRVDLPWVPVEKEYRFDTEHGEKSLADFFDGRSQLIVYHFMFGPDYKAGCPSCSSIADGFNGIVPHLLNHDVSFTAISRAPLAKLLGFKDRMGWSFPWASSSPSDFNTDFAVSFEDADVSEGQINYNYARQPLPEWRRGEAAGNEAEENFARQSGTDVRTYAKEKPGLSTFVLDEGVVYHCYSTYSRGIDAIWGVYPWLDRAPKGRNETGVWWKHHDKY